MIRLDRLVRISTGYKDGHSKIEYGRLPSGYSK